MVVVIPLVPSSLGGSPEKWEARLLDYGAGERLEGTIESLVEDLSPVLGADIDLAGFKITDTAQDLFEWTGSILNILGNPQFVTTVSSPADGHTLRYDSSGGDWLNAMLGAVDISYNDATTLIGESDVQGAIEYLVANGGGGGGGLAEVYDDKSPQLGDVLQLGHPSESSRNFWDHNGNVMFTWGAAASSVNYFQFTNAATANAPTIRAQGGDTNVDLQLLGKGTGVVVIATDIKLSGAVGDQQIIDQNDNEVLRFSPLGSAVNFVELFNAATGNRPSFRTQGDDTDVDLAFLTKGDGKIQLGADIIFALDPTILYDSNDNELLSFIEDASATQYLTITNAAIANDPIIGAAGDSSNISIELAPKGDGVVKNPDGTEYVMSYECEIVGATGGSVGSSEATAALSTKLQTRFGNAFTLDTGADDVTVPLDGLYEIIGVMSVDKSDAGVSYAELKIQHDQSASFADEANTDMRCTVNASEHGFVSTRALVNLDAGNQVRLRHNSPDTTQTVRQLRLSIRRLGIQGA